MSEGSTSPPRSLTPGSEPDLEAPDFDLNDELDPSPIHIDQLVGEWPWETDLPTIQIGIITLTHIMLALLRQLDGSLKPAYNFLRYALCGRAYNFTSINEGLSNDLFNQVRIDVGMDRTEETDDSVPTIMCDIDSVIAFTYTLDLQDTIQVFPIADFKRTLKDSNHLDLTIGDQLVPAHHVTNFCLATFKHRGKVNVFFPHLYRREATSRALLEGHLTCIYEEIIRPALVATMGEDFAAHLPLSRTAAMNTQKGVTGHISFKTIDVPSYRVEYFFEQFTAYANECSGDNAGLRQPIFMVEIRGTKAEFRWPMGDDVEREATLNSVRQFFGNTVDQALFFVDIATEISVPDEVLCLKTSEHAEVLAWAMDIPIDAAENAVQRSAFIVDPLAQIYALSGWRFQPPRTEAGLGLFRSVRYGQAYFTIKDAFALLGSKNMWQDLDASTMLPGRIAGTCEQLERLCDGIRELRDGGRGFRKSQDGAIRVEVRVNINDVSQYMVALNTQTAKSWAVAYSSQIFWTFIWCRCRAILIAAKMILAARVLDRGLAGSLQLAAGLVAMLNALFRRESPRSEAQALLNANGRRTLDDDMYRRSIDPEQDVDSTVCDGISQGLYFMSDLMLDSAPTNRTLRLPAAAVHVLRDHLARLFGFNTLRELQQKYGVQSEHRAQVAANPLRTHNRRKVPNANVMDVQAGIPEPADLPIEINAAIQFRPAPQAAVRPEPGFFGALLWNAEGRYFDIGMNPDTNTVAEYCQWLLRQFALDVWDCVANKSSRVEGSHTVMHPALRPEVTMDIFNTFDLTGVLAQAQVLLIRTDAEWKRYSGHAFPDPHNWTTSAKQNYATCLYWVSWREVGRNRLSQRQCAEIRTTLRLALEKLKWMPAFQADRIWVTKTGKQAYNHFLPKGAPRKPAVTIAINPRHQATALRVLILAEGPTPAQAARIAQLENGQADDGQ